MSTTNGTMKSFKITDKDGNVYVMIPVDTEARQEIDEGKFMDFDPDYFTSQLSQDQTTVNVGLNGVPLGVDSDSPLKFVQDTPQGIVFGSDAPFSTAIAPEYSASSTYAVGDHCMHLGKYYECNTAISTAEAWNSGHWTETDVNSLLRQVEVFQVTYDTDHYTWPSYSSIDSVVQKKKSVCLVQTNPAGTKFIYWLMFKPTSSANMYFRFANGSGNYVDIMSNDTVVEGSLTPKVESIAPEYDAAATYPTVGTAVMHDGLRYVSNTAINTAEDWTKAHWTKKSVEDEIGDVETLLAAL